MFDVPRRWIRGAVPTSWLSNFIATDGFGVAGDPLSHFVGATSCATPGTSDPGFEVLSSPSGPCPFFNGLTGGPSLLSLVLGPFKGLLAG